MDSIKCNSYLISFQCTVELHCRHQIKNLSTLRTLFMSTYLHNRTMCKCSLLIKAHLYKHLHLVTCCCFDSTCCGCVLICICSHLSTVQWEAPRRIIGKFVVLQSIVQDVITVVGAKKVVR